MCQLRYSIVTPKNIFDAIPISWYLSNIHHGATHIYRPHAPHLQGDESRQHRDIRLSPREVYLNWFACHLT